MLPVFYKRREKVHLGAYTKVYFNNVEMSNNCPLSMEGNAILGSLFSDDCVDDPSPRLMVF